MVSTNIEHTEGRLATMIEDQTAKLPSDIFLWSAMGCLITSAVLHQAGKPGASRLVGQWAPVLLIMGLYNKLVKTHGHD